MPGIEEISFLTLEPGTINIGITKSDIERVFSRTSDRSSGVLLSLLGRMIGFSINDERLKNILDWFRKVNVIGVF